MPITSLKFTNLGPFDEAKFTFDPQINVFVGPNNTGKSTILYLLGELVLDKFRVPRKLFHSVDIPDDFPSIGFTAAYGHDLPLEPGTGMLNSVGPILLATNAHRPPNRIRKLRYCLFVPAIRWNTDYRGSPTRPEEQGTDDCRSEAENLIRDEQIVQKMIDLDYRTYRKNKSIFRESIDRVFACVSAITAGYPIRYQRIEEDKKGLFVAVGTPDGTLPLNNLSQGTQALVQWIGRLILGYAEHYDYPSSYEDKRGILIVDEIDAHLHPSWQRRILPALTKEFPALQIFCSTHSPLMLAGLKAGQVHLLTRNNKGKVVVSRNETDIDGWSADEIMHTFLGVESTTDLETERRYSRLGELRAKDRLSSAESKELKSLRDTVSEASSKTPASTQVRAVAESLRQVVDDAIGAGNGRKSPIKKPARRNSKPADTKRTRPKAK